MKKNITKVVLGLGFAMAVAVGCSSTPKQPDTQQPGTVAAQAPMDQTTSPAPVTDPNLGASSAGRSR